MEFETLKLSHDDFISTVTIDNPPINAIDARAVEDLDAAFSELANRENLRAVILASALKKVFIAGADINQFIAWKKKDGIMVTSRGHEVLRKIAHFSKPVICAINGVAFGGGLEIALACDIRVIDKKAQVGLPETGLGVVPGYGGTQRLPRLVGPGMAKKLILTAQAIGAEEAYRIGIAEVLAEAGECLAEARKMAERISAQAPLAISAGKRCVDFAMEESLEDGIKFEIQSVGELADTEDKTEGSSAFLEKRPAVFKNK
ncbi:MAG: enoyl-CoA hydratase/isomerase family protein [Acidaminococcales bacterium]|jgi:enoyl-CoA hydratase/carnithine racemase|nr:enoyl-CoA hydratase/isomerase family protein [Acidaminococcales bacterium]